MITQPPCQPAISGGDGKSEIAEPPDAVGRLALGYTLNQCQKLLGSNTGVADEMAPEYGEGAAASFVVAAIGTKKRIRLISC